jgi:hypothetical protein
LRTGTGTLLYDVDVDLGKHVNGGESAKRKASVDVETGNSKRSKTSLQEVEDTPRGQLASDIQNLSLASTSQVP